ncbi:unnamed protein product [Brachionus calyciflorus]|uniref:Uncharacterized protein n=1 Tax=Brachionus calyciflorus TaxID=104777 RepID=A0A814A732_9BILA|nr:unnamed protein product [Brachionus calyciflorus]
MKKTTLILIVTFSIIIISLSIFLGVYFGKKSTNSINTSTAISSTIPLSTSQTTSAFPSDVLPLNLTIESLANITMELNGPNSIEFNANSYGKIFYLGEETTLDRQSLTPSRYNINFPIIFMSEKKLDPRILILYPRINSTLQILLWTEMNSKFVSNNFDNSTIYMNPKFSYSVGIINGDFFKKETSLDLVSYKTTSEMNIKSKLNMTITPITNKSLYYEYFLDINFIGNVTSSGNGTIG